MGDVFHNVVGRDLFSATETVGLNQNMDFIPDKYKYTEREDLVDEKNIEVVFKEYAYTGKLTPIQLKIVTTRLLGKAPLEADVVAMCSDGGCTLDLLKQYCIAQRPQAPFTTLFEEADKEHKGYIEYKDFIRVAGEYCGEFGTKLASRLFSHIDRDGDGLVCLSDLEMSIRR